MASLKRAVMRMVEINKLLLVEKQKSPIWMRFNIMQAAVEVVGQTDN